MDWFNVLKDILSHPTIVSLLTLITTLYGSYKLAMRRERKLKIVERHSDDLRALVKRWIEEIPTITFVGVPETSKPVIHAGPAEQEYLFADLKNHIPSGMNLFEIWQKFAEDYLFLNSNRFSLFQEIQKDMEKKLELPYNPDWKGYGFSEHFVEEIYRDVFRIVRNLRPTNLRQQTRVEKKGPDEFELWGPGHGLAQGNEREIKKVKQVRKQLLDELSSSRYVEEAKSIMHEHEQLVQSRERLVRQINNFISIPIFPGDCEYIRWATG